MLPFPQPSRRTVLRMGTAGALGWLLPSSWTASPQAQFAGSLTEVATEGRIYVNCSLRYKPEGKEKEEIHHQLIVAIDPTTRKWQRIADQAHFGRVSPDRQTLVFCREQEIWSCDAGGANRARKISDHRGFPIWSPDCKHLVNSWGHFGADHWTTETWQMRADGSDPTRLPIPDTDSVDDWSPDGQWFVTCSDRHPPHGCGYQLYLMRTDGTQQRRLTPGGLNCHARFSPDGRKIAYIRQTAKEGNSLWEVDTDGKNARPILEEINLVAPGGAWWSPDGKQLAVTLFNWELDENGRRLLGDPPNFRLEIMDTDGQNRRDVKLADARWDFIGHLGDWR